MSLLCRYHDLLHHRVRVLDHAQDILIKYYFFLHVLRRIKIFLNQRDLLLHFAKLNLNLAESHSLFDHLLRNLSEDSLLIGLRSSSHGLSGLRLLHGYTPTTCLHYWLLLLLLLLDEVVIGLLHLLLLLLGLIGTSITVTCLRSMVLLHRG